MKCPACSHEIPAEAKFCQNCGAQLQFDAARKKNPATPATKASAATDNVEQHGIPEDKTIWEGRFVPQAMYGYWAMALSITIATLVGLIGWGGGNSTAWWIGMIGLAVLWIFLIVLYWYRRHIVHYRLTKLRLFIEHGIIFKKVDRIDIMHLDKTDFTQGPLERLFKVGNLEIESEQPDIPKITLLGIANLRGVADLIDHARLEERLRRGVDVGAAAKMPMKQSHAEPAKPEVEETPEM